MRRRLPLIVALCAATAILLGSATAARVTVGDVAAPHASLRATPVPSALLGHAKRASASARDGIRATPWLRLALLLLVSVLGVSVGDDRPFRVRSRPAFAFAARAPPGL